MPTTVAQATPAQAVAAPRRFGWFLPFVLLLALAARVIYLGRAELWQDELGFLALANTRLSWGEIWHNSWSMIVTIGQLPLSILIFNLAFRLMEMFTDPIGPFTPALARLPAVLFGVIGVWTTYRLSTRLLDLAAARLVAVMAAIFFFPVYYSRETYCYAQILALAPLAVYQTIRVVYDQRRTMGEMLLLLGCLTALLYSHLGALMIVLALAGCLFVLWVWSWMRRDHAILRGALSAGLACGVAMLAIAPFVLRFALHDKAHTAGSPYTHLTILNDAVSKLFLGEQPAASAAAWLVLVIGLASLFLPHPSRRPRQLLGWITLTGLIAVTWATHRSQYLSARYFAPVAPLVLIVMGQGLFQLAAWLSRAVRLPESRRGVALAAVAAVPLAAHGLLFTPALLRLTEKSVPFGAVAGWINQNLAPGTPYVLESAYEGRWVGDAYPTPRNQAAAPYVHGSGPQEHVQLRERQSEFMTRFPEAPFIESAHHFWNEPIGLWDWPHRNFRQHTIVGHPEALKRLIRYGIYPGLPHEALSLYSYRIDIYHNTYADRVAIARAAGHPVLVTFDGWELKGQQVSQQETRYFRFIPGTRGAIRLANVSDSVQSGTLRLTLALPGPAGQRANLLFLKDGSALLQASPPTAQFSPLDVPVTSLPAGESVIAWQRSASEKLGEGLIVLDAEWVPKAP